MNVSARVAPTTLHPPRSAWIEVDLGILAENFRIIRSALAADTRLIYVAKAEAYGLGARRAVSVALAHGVDQIAVFTLGEAAQLRESGITAPILLLGEALPEDVPWILQLNLEPCVGRLEIARLLDEHGRQRRLPVPIHIKVNTGMNRFGFHWRESAGWSRELSRLQGLEFAGVLGHFAQSDEEDKTMARDQIARFQRCLADLRDAGVEPRHAHHCNSGGVLDLPEAHFQQVRVGILAHGIYPSSVCRRLNGLLPVMTVKARVAAIQPVLPGDTVGYGMRWQAKRAGRIAVLPIGYADGFPRVRNEGHILLGGSRAPIAGGVAMDALMVDITDLPEVAVGDEAVVMGRQGREEITAHELAGLKRSVSYDLLAGWRARLPRVYRNG